MRLVINVVRTVVFSYLDSLRISVEKIIFLIHILKVYYPKIIYNNKKEEMKRIGNYLIRDP